MPEFHVRAAEPGDVDAIVALMSAALGDGMPREVAYWRWKHELNPAGRSLVLVAEDADGLVGLRAMMRWSFRAGDRTLTAVRPVDTATHPRAQRRGLFTRLTTALLDQLADEGVSLVFNTPNDKSRPGYLKMGWRSVGSLPIWVRPGGRFAFRGGTRGEPFAPEGLALPVVDDGRLHTPRSEAYLRWRYADVPGLRYEVARDRDVSVVWRLRERAGRPELTVAELLCPRTPDGITRCARLLRRVIRAGDQTHAIGMAASRTREAAVLALAGFVPLAGRGPHLVVRDVPGGPALERDPLDPRSWRLQVGDLEVF